LAHCGEFTLKMARAMYAKTMEQFQHNAAKPSKPKLDIRQRPWKKKDKNNPILYGVTEKSMINLYHLTPLVSKNVSIMLYSR
jgi:hypothetical protein